MTTIYLAGASSEARLVASFAEKLVSDGFTLSYDWMTPVERAMLLGQSDAHLSPIERLTIAQDELRAARTSDVFWLLCPKTPSRGCWVELGARITCPDRGRTIVSGNHAASLFSELADLKFSTHERALDYLLLAARTLRGGP